MKKKRNTFPNLKKKNQIKHIAEARLIFSRKYEDEWEVNDGIQWNAYREECDSSRVKLRIPRGAAGKMAA